MKQAIFVCLLSLILLSILRAQNTSQTPIDDVRFERICRAIQAKLERSLSNTKIPGATVGFIRADGRRASFASGLRSLETRSPMQPSDPMYAGSIGKTFVAAVTLRLVTEGKLDLDTKIEHWLGDRAWFARLPNAKDITLRMLLQHSSGIPNHVEEKSFFKAAVKGVDRDIKYEDLLTFILDKKPLFPAGKGFYYADTNYILVGLIVEKVTGNTLYDEVSQRLLKPLGLSHTYPTNTNATPIVSGYFQNKPVIKNQAYLINPQWEWAGGGFGSTVGDLALWAKDLYSGNVLRKDILDTMLSSTSVGDGKNYGLGVSIIHSKWGTSYGHNGEFPGYLSEMRYYPQYGFAVAAQINADETEGSAGFMESVADDFAQVIIEETSDRKLSEAEKREFSSMAESWVKLVDAGKYAESWDSISTELKAKYTRETWPTALEPFLKTAGKIKVRTLKSVVSSEPGKIAVDFDSSFSKLKVATETVFLKLEKDGKWHVSSYSIN